ncbi:Chromosome partition protein smc [Rhodovulum sp. PH10]|uniref:chromosome segregation protein SMC n=1 Tax=Rhodovulum sp. PH10 TaxID=1187851 RepID=UPI00027C29D4|nr:chromosome segregation protein SMC [Rhodovulum sp. PH10]EJW12987.1 Chromosome partition protein smc [Rhodovulum sp. PH10]
MKFQRLRLVGFKTFVEPTDFMIEPGLTGVVGPNGCGKSNLVEAMRWVMGEASHKAMRAADMNDVIFSGNQKRPARNTAEVSILIDNTARTAPAQFNGDDQLEVSRRIEREQGSTYRVNGREVRARDVQILFADASSGSRSPAMVHQGRIGEIIQAKPEQRRRVLEEAAGISGLHARRHEAELRLRAAEQNLLRLEDVIGQLGGQIESLKRQARQAVRYKALSGHVRKAEATLFHVRWRKAGEEVAAAARAQEASVREVAERTAVQADAATRQGHAFASLPALREAEAKAAAALQRLVSARDLLTREEARAAERTAELDRRIQQIAVDRDREAQMLADADGTMARLAAERETLEEELAAGEERRFAVEEKVAEAGAAVAETEQKLAALTAALAEIGAKRRALEGAMRSNSERAARTEQELAGVTAELDRMMADANEAVDLEGLAEAAEIAQEALAEAEAASVRAEAAHSGARQALDVARQPLAEAERRVNRLETEAKTLAKVLHVEATQMWPPVIDLITVDKGFETALGAALGDDLDAPVEASAPIRWTLSEGSGDDPALPAGIDSLGAHVSKAPPELARRLAQIGVVARDDGPRLAKLLKPGQRLVTPDGDLWRWDGFAVAAHAPTGAARRLAERNRLADIEGELAAAREELETRREAAEAARQEVAEAAAAEQAAREARRQQQRAAQDARDRQAAAEREMGRLTARRAGLVEAQSRLAASRDEARAAAEEAAAALEELAPSDELEAELAEVQAKVSGERTTLAEARAAAQALAREIDLTTRRLTGVATDIAAWETRKGSAGEQIETLAARLAEATEEREGLAEAPAQFALKRRALIGEIEAAEAERREAADALAAAETALADADRADKAARDAMSAARESAVRAEERHEAAKRRLAEVAREIQEVLEVQPDALPALAEITPDAALPDPAEIEAKLERLRRERERLGAVNLRADDELNEVEQQHGTLTSEREDLTAAIKRLRQGIQSLNKEARDRLLASFEVVNEHFKRLFTTLFGGGTAELQLTESEDPLEAGLDILAKPPGKKPATLSLLSGGEQALTAMALIFAVFLTNPAPICVLDEVDAPLDDHNVDRFCDLLVEMTKSTETRFVIITHNPITMARMNRLFGVTMAERGVSQLVSVDLEEAVKFQEAV